MNGSNSTNELTDGTGRDLDRADIGRLLTTRRSVERKLRKE